MCAHKGQLSLQFLSAFEKFLANAGVEYMVKQVRNPASVAGAQTLIDFVAN
jgi:hypothetical protein